jgi:SAM-dependent methyltransferase
MGDAPIAGSRRPEFVRRLRDRFPGLARLYGAARRAVRLLPARLRPMRSVFTRIYRDRRWEEGESASGPGSDLEQTVALRRELPALLAELEVRTLLDAACGDFHWLKEVDLPIERYYGVDIVEEVVERNRERYGGEGREFLLLNLAVDRLPRADAILCRDCLVHLRFGDIARAMANFRRSGARFLLATTFAERETNEELEARGLWRPLNLRRPPFNFPPPERLIDEGCTLAGGAYRDKRLGVWRLERLP